jgi:hypothetical protein
MAPRDGGGSVELDKLEHDALTPDEVAFTLDVLARGLALLHGDLALVAPDPDEVRDGEGADRVEARALGRRDADCADATRFWAKFIKSRNRQ